MLGAHLLFAHVLPHHIVGKTSERRRLGFVRAARTAAVAGGAGGRRLLALAFAPMRLGRQHLTERVTELVLIDAAPAAAAAAACRSGMRN